MVVSQKRRNIKSVTIEMFDQWSLLGKFNMPGVQSAFTKRYHFMGFMFKTYSESLKGSRIMADVTKSSHFNTYNHSITVISEVAL